ncbi:MAG: twin-arginine translocase TatA/TatE family subunit [Firmicutes bacterium]|nr:twin-arginine translocase TatA/TatE family subunit [Alicyclobacillaceae bacterium]MCL6496574.1 twin-arginine translocase TatA/TatE family subunit [Bacillota bacterium]
MDLISPMHIILLLIIALLVFGPRKLPEIGAGLGRSIREFKRSMNAINDPEERPGETSTAYAIEAKDPQDERR